MKKVIYLLFTLSFFGTEVQAQSESPYKTKFAIDAPITVVGAGLSYYGLTLLTDKEGVPEAELQKINMNVDAAIKDDVPKFDRFVAGNYSLSAKKASDYPFYASFAGPLLLLFDEDIRGNAGQTGVLYLETMAITGAFFTMAAGNTNRNRPLVYISDPNEDIEERYKRHAQNSFFAGHTAATASATFFVAKVFHDYNPDSGLRPVVWGVAAAVPAAVGYFRLKAGKHFLSDNILGYVIGSSVGILVPQLHKTSNKTGLSLTPIMYGPEKGVSLSYNIK